MRLGIKYRYSILISFVFSLLYLLYGVNYHKYYDGFEIVGFSNSSESISLSYETKYGFNDYQKYILPINSTLIKIKPQNKYKLIFNKNVPNKDIGIFISNTNIFTVMPSDRVVVADSNKIIKINNCSNLKSININNYIFENKSQNYTCYFNLKPNDGYTLAGFQAFTKSFSNWEFLIQKIQRFWITPSSAVDVYTVNSDNYMTKLLFNNNGISTNFIAYPSKNLPFTFVLGKALAVILIIFFVFYICSNYKRLILFFYNVITKPLQLLVLFYFIIYLVAFYPGVYMWDSMSPIITSHAYSFYLWYGLGIDLFYMIFANLGLSHGVFILQWILFMALFLSVFAYAKKNNVSNIVQIILIGLLMISAIGFMSVYLYRDILGALFTCWSLFLSFTMIYENAVCFNKLIKVFGISYLGYLIRADNLIIWGSIFLLIMYILFKQDKKQTMVLFLIFFIVLLKLASYISDKSDHSFSIMAPNYMAASLVNPLVGIINIEEEKNNHSNLIKQANNALGVLVNNESVVKSSWSPYHVIYWHVNHKLINTEQLKIVQKSLLDLILHYPLDFLKVRMATFSQTISAQPLSNSDYSVEQGNHDKTKQAMDFNLFKVNPGYINSILVKYVDYIGTIGIFQQYSYAINRQYIDSYWAKSYFLVLFFYLLGFMIIIFTIFSFKFCPVSALLSIVILIRSFAVFILAPASIFTYYLDVYIWIFIVPILYNIEYFKRKA